jgi:hypothetical protein
MQKKIEWGCFHKLQSVIVYLCVFIYTYILVSLNILVDISKIYDLTGILVGFLI